MEFRGFTTGLLIIVGGIIASIVLVAAVRRIFSKDVLRQGHDITGTCSPSSARSMPCCSA